MRMWPLTSYYRAWMRNNIGYAIYLSDGTSSLLPSIV